MKTLVAALLALISALASDPSVTGTWNMGLQGDHVIPVALVLKQDGTKVTGTIAMPTQHVGQRVEVEVSGEFVDMALTLSGTVESAKEPTTITISGKLNDEGAIEGKVQMPHGSVPFTAERLKERK